ncbi:hypothetical protein ACLESO_51045 [Pyxidicoccus sp. 3LG]
MGPEFSPRRSSRDSTSRSTVACTCEPAGSSISPFALSVPASCPETPAHNGPEGNSGRISGSASEPCAS